MSINSKMTAIADAIRAKTGASEPLTLDGMAAAVAGMSAGGAAKRAAGSFTTNASCQASVNCGFRPDVVIVYTPSYKANSTSTYETNLKFFFTEKKTAYEEMSNAQCDDSLYEGIAVPTDTGFHISMMGYSFSWSKKPSIVTNKNFQYVAVQYMA